MSHHTQTQLLVGALSTMGQLAAHRHRQQQALAVEDLRSGVLAHMVDAFVTHRVDAVKEGFLAILSGYAEQARHFMAQQQKYADAEIASCDPLTRMDLRNRIQDIDHELSTIRIDAKLIYQNMTEIIAALGGSPADFAVDVKQPLALTDAAPW